tara:strand:+ start:6770 stop:7051 length:282 start_codon:yes stop_codon:yes gene_type:complete
MNYYVYLLISDKKNKFATYVGYTNNINKRLKLHNTSKGARYTRGKKWKILYKEAYSSKSVAMSREYSLKKNKKFRNLLKENFLKRSNIKKTQC